MNPIFLAQRIMGNCSSSTKTVDQVEVSAETSDPPQIERLSTDDNDECIHAILDAFLPIILPSVQRQLSESLVEGGYVIRDEKPVTSLTEDDLPIGPIIIQVGTVRAVDAKRLYSDMETTSNFDWPERDRAKELMEKRQGMVVLDLLNTDVKINFGRGVELKFPVSGPMRMKGEIEVGSGGDIERPWIKLEKLKVRVWFVNKTGKIYIAIMDQPKSIVPSLHANLDRGGGDFSSKVYSESGTMLDNVVEKLLSRFSPTVSADTPKGVSSKWNMDVMKIAWASVITNLTTDENRRPLEVYTTLKPSILTEDSADSTGALISALLPVVLPIVRQAISKGLIEEGMVLRNEEPVARDAFPEEQLNNTLPIHPLLVKIGDVRVVELKVLLRDMEARPNFRWPERDRVIKQMGEHHENDAGMLVLDLSNLDVEIRLDKGIELAVPVEGPMGMKASLEVGSGGSIDEASIQFKNLDLRIWFIAETLQIFVASMSRPDIIPSLHLNVDRGRGDFMNMTFTESGTSLDDVLEKVISGFGPRYTEKDTNEKSSWAGDAIGGILLSAMGTFLKLGNGRPLDLQAEDQIKSIIDIALGNPRSVELVEADMAILQKELEVAKKKEKQEVDANKVTNNTKKSKEPSMRETEDSTNDTGFSSDWVLENLPCCSLPQTK